MRDIRYKWNAGQQSVGISNEVELPQFRVLGHRQRHSTIHLSTGRYPPLISSSFGTSSRGSRGRRTVNFSVLLTDVHTRVHAATRYRHAWTVHERFLRYSIVFFSLSVLFIVSYCFFYFLFSFLFLLVCTNMHRSPCCHTREHVRLFPIKEELTR